MGSFFSNLHLRAKDPASVVPVLRPLLGAGGALISPEHGGWITLYPETTEDQDWSKVLSLSQKLSRRLETAIYGTMVHDSSVFVYSLYEKGRRLDEYSSRPDYFGAVSDEERAALDGNPAALLRFCGSEVSETQIDNILKKRGVFLLNPLNRIFAEGVAKALAACLGIRGNRALSGFTYASRGELGEPLSSWLEV